MSRRTRFAPSPTGWLHLGHAFAAEEAFGWGRTAGHECLLRIEDIDATRCRAEYAAGLLEDLRWLGFAWPEPVRVQSGHLADYDAVADTLRGMGVLYPCGLSRKEVAARAEGGVFRGRAMETDGPAWRLDVRAAAERTGPLTYTSNGEVRDVDVAAVSDEILVRRDIGTGYHIAVTHDDARQGITDVVRGEDLLGSTPVQRILQALMGWPEPRYHHHALVTDGERKLSKRDGDASVRAMRGAGVSAEEVLARAREAAMGGA